MNPDAITAARLDAHRRKLCLVAELVRELGTDAEHLRDQVLIDAAQPSLPSPVGEMPDVGVLGLDDAVLANALRARGWTCAPPTRVGG